MLGLIVGVMKILNFGTGQAWEEEGPEGIPKTRACGVRRYHIFIFHSFSDKKRWHLVG